MFVLICVECSGHVVLRKGECNEAIRKVSESRVIITCPHCKVRIQLVA